MKKSTRVTVLLAILFFLIPLLIVFYQVNGYWYNGSKYIEKINSKWEINLSNQCERVTYEQNGFSISGEGVRCSIFNMSEEEINKADINWVKGNKKEQKSTILVNLKYLDLDDSDYPPLDKSYKYAKINKGEYSWMVLLYFPELKKLYVIEIGW